MVFYRNNRDHAPAAVITSRQKEEHYFHSKNTHPMFQLLLSHHDNRRSIIFYGSNRKHAPAVDLTS